ncbi:hypothetical protein GCK32_000827 [Trichostrongylus colubriformis]|uniref:SET domain-containing protein n=1 Tax=Trichostrongylus colubriformis TaxID=6319 RepID=A0AAN8FRL5_TRICO
MSWREAKLCGGMEKDYGHRYRTPPPPTRASPAIPRQQLCITVNVTDDTQYTGGASVHPVFFAPPDKTLMFAHQHDDWSEDEERQYYVQTYTIPPNSKRSLRWMNVVDSELKLWRKLIREQHPILQHFYDYLKSRTTVPVRASGGEQIYQETRNTCKSYASNVERFMLVAMRSRKRLEDILKQSTTTEFASRPQQQADILSSTKSLRSGMSRHGIARMEYDRSMQARTQALPTFADPDIARMQSHQPSAQVEYVRQYEKSCVYGYVKISVLSWAESVMGRRSRAVPTASRQEVEISSESSDESLYDDVVGDYEVPSAVGEPSQIAGSSEARSRYRKREPAPVAVASRAENIQPPVARGAKTISRAPAVPSEATAEDPSEATAEDIQPVARDIRATTTSRLAMTSPIVMEIEGESSMLERTRAAAERMQRQQEERLRQRYASMLPETADPGSVLSYMQELNSRQYDGGLGYYQTEYERQCFNLRRLAQPIQDFPWLEIRDIPSIGGRGLFAKVPIRKDQVVGEQLMWNYGRHYSETTSVPMPCLCQECQPQLESSAQLRIPVMIPPRIEVIPSDDGSCSQQMAISHRIAIQRAIDVRNVITSRNVFYSLNVKTRVAGLVPPSGPNMLVSPSDAYRHSRLMFLGSEVYVEK